MHMSGNEHTESRKQSKGQGDVAESSSSLDGGGSSLTSQQHKQGIPPRTEKHTDRTNSLSEDLVVK